jgi:hypothetical protein
MGSPTPNKVFDQLYVKWEEQDAIQDTMNMLRADRVEILKNRLKQMQIIGCQNLTTFSMIRYKHRMESYTNELSGCPPNTMKPFQYT